MFDMDLTSYPKVYALGHKSLGARYMDNEFIVQEKIDGSQFSFGKIGGKIRARSRNVELPTGPGELEPSHMFSKAVDYIRSISERLPEGTVFRCEYLARPKHNTLVYDRVPRNHLILFDVMTGLEAYTESMVELRKWAQELEIGAIPVFHEGRVDSALLDKLLKAQSCLGGKDPVEGVVLKQYTRYDERRGKPLFAKIVRADFKEKHQKRWKSEEAVSSKSIVEVIGSRYATTARWHKAIQHLRDAGQLEGSPKDIGVLLMELRRDFVEECQDEVKEELWKWARKGLLSQIREGFPEFYKQQLIDNAFEESEDEE